MKLLVFAASHRPASYNRKLAKVAASHAQAKGTSVDFAEYSEFDMPMYNDTQATGGSLPDSARSFASRMASANGLIVSSPEYNWSYPGTLKNIIDWTSRIPGEKLRGKTVLLLCATPSSRGGIVCLSHLRSPFEALGMVAFNKAFPLSQCLNAFSDAGALADTKQDQQLAAMVSDFVTFTEKLTK